MSSANIGKTYFGMTVLDSFYDKYLWYKVRCEKCGAVFDRAASSVLKGTTRCECSKRHHPIGDNRRLYNIYNAMKARCYNPNNNRYYRYGARGITVCEEWLGNLGFQNFKKWAINNGYRDGLTIDRIDNDSSYSPANCRWATYEEQANNTSRNHYVEINGVKLTFAQTERLFGIPKGTLNNRINKLGWTMERVLSELRVLEGQLKAERQGL